ncbi:hypothetical protein ACQY0O_004897 [Thecaphora frezii]
MQKDPTFQTTPYDIPSHAPFTPEQAAAQTAHFQRLKEQLAVVFHGHIATRGEDLFRQSVRLFNDAAPLGGWIVALPTSAHEISVLIRFCNQHKLSPSIRSGGFATAGWAIQGDLIIDTCKMNDVRFTLPRTPRLVQSNAATAAAPSSAQESVAGFAAHPRAPASSAQPAISATASDNASVTLFSPSVSDVGRVATAQIHDPNTSMFNEDVAALDAAKQHGAGTRIRKADEAFCDAYDHASASRALDSGASSAFVRRKTEEVPTSSSRDAAGPSAGARVGSLEGQGEGQYQRQDHGCTSISRWASVEKGQSGESGADADSESSSEHSGQHETRQPSPRVPDLSDDKQSRHVGVGGAPQGYMAGSAPQDQALMFDLDAKKLTRRPPTSWVDRQLDQRGKGSASSSASASGSGGTRSSHNASSSTSAVPSHDPSSGVAEDLSSSHISEPKPWPVQGQVATPMGSASAHRSASPMAINASTSLSISRASTVSESNSGSSGRGGRGSQSHTPDDWDPNSHYEHQRWQKHHRPQGAVGERISLPPGAFVWRSDGDVTTTGSAAPGELPWDSAAFAASHDNVNPDSAYNVQTSGQMTFDPNAISDQLPQQSFAARSLADLQSAWPTDLWAVNPAAAEQSNSGNSLPHFIPSSLQGSSRALPMQGSDASNPFNFIGRTNLPSPSASTILPPGVHANKYALVSFGPGAGIRALDAFTDKAGREGNFAAPEFEERQEPPHGKGKERVEAFAPKTFVVNGVPYHVPVSAYPVGSTAMTTGGFGYLTRAYGLSLDNIVEVEMVLADGRIVTLNEDSKHKSEEERDLWWAVRGAAPCFGVVSRIVAKAYPVPSVYSGNLIYPLNPATASSLIRHWRDCLKAGLPNAFYSNLILTAGPSKTSHVIVIQICFLGPKSEGEALVQAISSWSGERTLLKDVEERSFLNQQDGVAQVLKGGAGRRWMVRGDLINTLTDEMISESVRNFQGLGSRAVWLFELLGGAVEDVGEDETCISQTARTAKFTVGSLQQWNGQAEDQKCIQSVERWLNEVVGKVSVGGPFPCFLGRSERLERVVGAYGPRNFRRLLQIKKRVDPDGLFRHTYGHGLVLDDVEVEAVLTQLEERETERAVAEANGSQSEGVVEAEAEANVAAMATTAVTAVTTATAAAAEAEAAAAAL